MLEYNQDGGVGMYNTTLCYIERDGAYLMLHRVKKENDVNRDKWVGIGGKFEVGESPHECAAREISEETGLTPTKLDYRGIVTFYPVEAPENYELMHLFTCTEYTGRLRNDCNEGVLEFYPKSKLHELPMWEGDAIFLRLLDTEPRFFSLKLVYDHGRLVSHKIEYCGM